MWFFFINVYVCPDRKQFTVTWLYDSLSLDSLQWTTKTWTSYYNDHIIYTYQHPTSSWMGESISVKLCMNFVMHTVIINICMFFKNIYYKCKFFLILYSLSPNRSDVIFYICVYFMCQVNCMSLKFDMNTKYGKKYNCLPALLVTLIQTGQFNKDSSHKQPASSGHWLNCNLFATRVFARFLTYYLSSF